MKIKLDELKKLAEQVKISMTDEELEEIGNSISLITDQLDEIMKEDVDDYGRTRTNANTLYSPGIDKNAGQGTDEALLDIMDLNNNDGEYVVIEKEGGNNDD